MATYNELIYNLKNLYEGGIGSDDDNIADDQIIFMFDYYRAKLIREDLMKGRSISPFLIQEIGCMELETVDKSDCCDIKTDCYILKTKEKLPKVIEVYDKNLIVYIGSPDHETSFPLGSEVQNKWAKYNKYTSDAVRSFIRGDYLYIINSDTIDFVTVQAVFENPKEIAKFKTCDGKPCFSYEDQYPVSAHMISVITQLISERELRLMNTFPGDTINDAKGKPDGT